ncbi:hypothetical protein GCM10027590_54970 [Nocardiopsis nanhaiensis]
MVAAAAGRELGAKIAVTVLFVLLPFPYLLEVVFEVEGPYTDWVLWALLVCMVYILLGGAVIVVPDTYRSVRDIFWPKSVQEGEGRGRAQGASDDGPTGPV